MKHGPHRVRERSAQSITFTRIEFNLLLQEAEFKATGSSWPEDRAAWRRITTKLQKAKKLARRIRIRK